MFVQPVGYLNQLIVSQHQWSPYLFKSQIGLQGQGASHHTIAHILLQPILIGLFEGG